MKTLIPWLCVVALLGGVAYLYSANQKKEAELVTLRESSTEVDQLRTQVAELKKTQTAPEEIERLRKDAEDVLRLRNEVRQLREDKQQLTQQAQTAQASADRAQAQAQAERQRVQEQAQALIQAQANVLARAQSQPVAVLNACINNLRQIDGAKQQWALENMKSAEAVPTAEQIAPYIKNGFPTCPAGGKYTIGKVGDAPTCSIPGHTLPGPC